MRGTSLAAAACVVAACTGGGALSGSAPASATPTANTAPVATATAEAPTSASDTGGGDRATWGTRRRPGPSSTRTRRAPASPPACLPTGAAHDFARWTAVTLDGCAVYGQPLVVGGDVIAATENDSVYAISRATGKTVWRAHVGTPVPQSALHGCGDIFPLGITGTPVYDQGDGLVYAVAETTGYQHVLFGLAASDGKVEVKRDLDQPTGANQPAWNQQRPALAIDDGRVYAAFGGLAGDCGAYIGGVVGVALNGNGPLVSWHTPTSREGAVWGTGGPVVGPNGDLWVSNGNGAGQAPSRPLPEQPGSDSVHQPQPDPAP